jgi:hypothetical protein
VPVSPEKFSLKNGDTFIGYVVFEEKNRITIKVERLVLLGKNIVNQSERAGVSTLVHSDGTVFSGNFRKSETGDFHLDLICNAVTSAVAR